MNAEKRIIILGAGGHASVVAELLKVLNKSIFGFVAPNQTAIHNYPEIPYLGTDETFVKEFKSTEFTLVNGVGSTTPQRNEIRQTLFNHFKNEGYAFETLVHPSACVASTAILNEGCQIMARAVIQPNVIVHPNVIINTAASIDHDCEIGHSVHVAPGAVLSGNVCVGENALVGVGSTVIQGVTIGSLAMICAGRIVENNIQANVKFKG